MPIARRAPSVRAMNTFRPTRIVALALITLTTAGLLYLHFSLDSDRVSVPSGAQAG